MNSPEEDQRIRDWHQRLLGELAQHTPPPAYMASLVFEEEPRPPNPVTGHAHHCTCVRCMASVRHAPGAFAISDAPPPQRRVWHKHHKPGRR